MRHQGRKLDRQLEVSMLENIEKYIDNDVIERRQRIKRNKQFQELEEKEVEKDDKVFYGSHLDRKGEFDMDFDRILSLKD